ncbi:fructosamine kinase family protein [Gracilibacillus sp. S3-1-1]|uniref:Fructosamine kinase family protein n=1 Tax=Gracilibacillus pellucidus TaxID=3095368 RepID=A0ACC6M2U2_9BACI|nr:fructosamine kinase family protein [Gracilibacillus sp. S3-1-1]MDX8045057.1 fructosamine kinase family protein [Gracilibacillus sp. S3-1-1]
MQTQIKSIGDHSPIQIVQPVAGGDINQAYYVQTAERNYFVKTNQHVPANFFQIEANGLEKIRATNTIAVPTVYHYDSSDENGEMVLIMEWIEGEQTSSTNGMLGENVAALHLADNSSSYGLDQTTFIGQLTQENSLYNNWVDYFREKRLTPQLDLAIRKGRMNGERRKHLEKLITNLEQYLPTFPRVSLLHGDLWGGNWISGNKGEPYLIDPSIVYGDHLFEIAFTELFGGFSADFYYYYQNVFPLENYYKEVKPIYQLYYLLAHLNMFGESYGSSVDSIVLRY